MSSPISQCGLRVDYCCKISYYKCAYNNQQRLESVGFEESLHEWTIFLKIFLKNGGKCSVCYISATSIIYMQTQIVKYIKDISNSKIHTTPKKYKAIC